MNEIYQHYKGKLYRYRGTARHSETLEELVLYEALYENKLGKIWVRPKSMFFENIEVDGKLVPRFRKISDEEFALIHEHWRPKVIAELNGQEVKPADTRNTGNVFDDKYTAPVGIRI